MLILLSTAYLMMLKGLYQNQRMETSPHSADGIRLIYGGVHAVLGNTSLSSLDHVKLLICFS